MVGLLGARSMAGLSARRGEGAAYLGVGTSLSGRRWVDRLGDGDEAVALAIAQTAAVPGAIPDIVARILAGRGVSADAAARFLDPTIRDLLPDPDRLTDMAAAAARLADAVTAGESVAILGDYDVDGASSAALLARYLRTLGLMPTIYIPDRLFEGYGPNVQAVRQLAEGGARLLVTVDCGTTSADALAEAKALGLDVVVIDHHQPGGALPPALALVNPKRDDDLSGLDHLAAVGLVFVTLVAVNRELRRRGRFAGGGEPDLRNWLDLVALGTICDCVPLLGLNRAFVVKGLLVLARGDNPGLAALARRARLSGPLGASQLGFAIGPRINAGGRIGNASLGSRLLASDDLAEVAEIAETLETLNVRRQEMEARQVAEAVAGVEAEIGAGPAPPVVVAANADWHPGVVGLIAARLKERFARPAFAIALANGLGTGSGRSVEGADLGASVRRAVERGLLTKGGGHAMAAGVTLEAMRLGDFKAFLFEDLAAQMAGVVAGDDLRIDAPLLAAGATVELLERIAAVGPFGMANPEPVFAFPAHRVAFIEVAGERHLRLAIAAADGVSLKAMAFRAAGTRLGAALLANRDRPMHFAGTLALDHWQGRTRPTLTVIDAALLPD